MDARLLALLLALAVPGAAAASALDCTGRVVLDRDGDGHPGPREPGIAGVKVSDGTAIVATDAKGRYRLATQPGRTIQLVKPAGYAVPSRDDGLPDTWFNLAPVDAPTLAYGGLRTTRTACGDFALRRQADAPGPMQVLVFGDPQPKTALDVDYFRRDIVEPLLAQGVHEHAAAAPRLGITLGDVVSDDLSLFPGVKAQTVRLRKPWLHVPGNHDLDFDAPTDLDSLSSYREAFGADTFAWEEPAAVFVGLDNIVYDPATRDYVPGVREDQFAFLAAYLPTVPRDRLLVVAAHAPFFDTGPGKGTFRAADRARLFALLRDFPHLLLLTAHSHVQQHHYHGPAEGWTGAAPLHEFNVGTTCGAFWSGRKDAAGIPAATMSDGTPNGYALLDVRGDGGYAIAWHVARADGDPRLALHAPRVLRRGAYPAYGVYANVFLGDAATVVEFRVDGGDWQKMKKVDKPDPALLAENAADDTSPQLRGYDRSPEATVSAHLWRGTLPTDLAAGEHRVDVRANGQWVGEAQATTSYRLDEAAP
jgi:hypothetical protein